MKVSLKTQQTGSAIIFAIFIMAIVAAVGTAILVKQRYAISNTAALLTQDKAYWYTQGISNWAQQILVAPIQGKQADDTIIDNLVPILRLKLPEGLLMAQLQDLQGRFNLNNLAVAQYQPDFKRLLKITNPSLKDEQINTLTSAIVEWITPVQATSALDEYYRKLPSPYRAAHRPMVSMSELRLVAGMTPQIYNSLEPYIIALPATTPININTASIPVLMSLSPDLTLDIAQAIIEQRSQEPFKKIDDFLQASKVNFTDPPTTLLTVTSDYFMAIAKVTTLDSNFSIISILKRSRQQDKSQLKILWQSFGAL